MGRPDPASKGGAFSRWLYAHESSNGEGSAPGRRGALVVAHP